MLRFVKHAKCGWEHFAPPHMKLKASQIMIQKGQNWGKLKQSPSEGTEVFNPNLEY